MPTTSQYQILKRVKFTKTSSGMRKMTVSSKLQLLDINDEEEDILGLNKLQKDIVEAREKINLQIQNDAKTDQNDSTTATRRALPTKRIRGSLFRLGFRKPSTFNLKTNLPEERKSSILPKMELDTDEIIKSLLYNKHSVKKRKPPELKPLAVCFNYPGSVLTHQEVKMAIDELLVIRPEVKMVKIEFQPRCKLLRIDKMDNTCRWVITFDSEWGRCIMTGVEFYLRDTRAVLKRYDDLVSREFKQFGRMAEIMKIIKNC